MEPTVMDNFLPEEDFKIIQQKLMWGDTVRWVLQDSVSGLEEDDAGKGAVPNWNFFGVCPVYEFDTPISELFSPLRKTFGSKLEELKIFKSLIRMKINFYPWTYEIKEHDSHTDFPFSHIAGIFSLNTCDGYTGFPNGDRIDSVANRMLFFDGSEPHHSTTTSNAPGRFNIAFNFV
tara:strand:+ start:246 stop:773 length:528 start_codon:yes stop_codon:yes gene_type:complete